LAAVVVFFSLLFASFMISSVSLPEVHGRKQPDATDRERQKRQFIGLDALKNALREQKDEGCGSLQKFEEWARTLQWHLFGPDYNHYDWWMFPIPERSNSYDMKFAVFEGEIAALKADEQYMRDYRRGLELLMASWGWDLYKSSPIQNPTASQIWNHWDIRLYKAGLSALAFREMEIFRSMEQFARSLISTGVQLEKKVKDLWNIRVTKSSS